MATYNNIFDLNVKYIEYLLAKSLFTHQYVKNVQESGSGLESEIRILFSKLIPKRFKVTHGYIASAQSVNQSPSVSPQVDLIIVDTFVPHSLFVIDDDKGLEIVPVESVVGIFEIKRTLNRKSLLGTKKSKGALEHLHDICRSVNIRKNNSTKYLPGGLQIGGGISGGLSSNPFLGILSIDYSDVLVNGKRNNTLEDLLRIAPNVPEFDLIASLGGLMYGLIDPTPPHNWRILNPRLANSVVLYGTRSKNKNTSHVHLIARTFGYLIAYLEGCCGRNGSVENYFFNNTI
ncbi:MAG: hypothetical protein RLO81_07785 [Fulvivirga sp.]|uniref:DUF6602 domain-containing protein n=1 Tax=Fulvivirga sp. TaxID=1931237 RepID=UPI0032EC3CC1